MITQLAKKHSYIFNEFFDTIFTKYNLKNLNNKKNFRMFNCRRKNISRITFIRTKIHIQNTGEENPYKPKKKEEKK